MDSGCLFPSGHNHMGTQCLVVNSQPIGQVLKKNTDNKALCIGGITALGQPGHRSLPRATSQGNIMVIRISIYGSMPLIIFSDA